MIGPNRVEGYAIVSADGMIADAAGKMPDTIRNPADQSFLQAELDRAAMVVHGRHSHEGGPRSARRKRLIVTRGIVALSPDPSQPNTLLWNPAGATLEELRDRIVETKFSRLPVYEKSLDEIIGIVVARDILEVSERDAPRRTVRELMRPALLVPETKFGSELLKDMQRKNQKMAIVIDEYGLVAGVVTVEDLVEEIVGEIGEEDRRPAPDVVREASGAMILRGSVPVDKIGELFGVELDSVAERANATTIAGLLNGIAGHVPRTGEIVEFEGLRFEVLEANQRKVLRVRARRAAAGAASSARTV